MSRYKRSVITLSLMVLLLFSVFGCVKDENGDETTTPDTTKSHQNDTLSDAEATDTEAPSSELNIEGNTLIFGNAHDDESRFAFSDTMEALEKGYEKYKNVDSVLVGEGKLDICFREHKDFYGNTSYDVLCSGISAFGHTYTFEEPHDLYGNFVLYTFTSDGAFVFEYEYFDTFVITEKGVVSLLQGKERNIHNEPKFNNDKDAISDWQNQSFYSFTLREDGTLGYTRTPRKYLHMHSCADQIIYCVSLDEFAMEEGYVTFEDLKPVYHPERKYTADEVYDIEGMYDQIIASCEDKENIKEYLKLMGLPAVDSLEEFLAYNKANYKEAE